MIVTSFSSCKTFYSRRDYMLRKILLTVPALAIVVGTAALAAPPKGPLGPNGIFLSPNGLAIATKPPALPYVRVPGSDAGLTKIFDNLAHRYPDGEYWCCTSYIISGSSSEFGAESWIGAPFTPGAGVTVSKIVLGLFYDSGKTKLVVTLNSDSGGLPGKELASATVSRDLPDFPSCCAVEQVKIDNVPLSAGQQYWVVVKTAKKDSDTFGGWAFNDTEQIALANVAFNDGSGWQPLQSFSAPAFEVLGK
jgi:hypothetical protein